LNRLEMALSVAVLALRAEGGRFALVGGLAVSARAEPRFTRDADLAVSVASDQDAERLVRALMGRGFGVVAQIEQKYTGRLATVRLSPPDASVSGLVIDLLFASSGIEPEVVEGAETLRLSAHLALPVARLEHLLALKVLSMDDRSRPQDRLDINALLDNCTGAEIDACRRALVLIGERGFSRDKRLLPELDALLRARGH